MNSGLANFKKHLSEDKDWLISWHSNIAMWLSDNLGIVNHKQRNEMAEQFINHFFGIKYNWEQLLGGGKDETV